MSGKYANVSAAASSTPTFTTVTTGELIVPASSPNALTGFYRYTMAFTGTVAAPNKYYLLWSTSGVNILGYMSSSNAAFAGTGTKTAAFSSASDSVNQFALDGRNTSVVASWTCTGVKLGDAVIISTNPALPLGLTFRAQVISANTIRVDAFNDTFAAVTLTGYTFIATVIQGT